MPSSVRTPARNSLLAFVQSKYSWRLPSHTPKSEAMAVQRAIVMLTRDVDAACESRGLINHLLRSATTVPSAEANCLGHGPCNHSRPAGTKGRCVRQSGVGDTEQHVSVAGLVEPAPASNGLAAQLGASGVLVQVTLEQGDRFLAVMDTAVAVAAGLANRMSVRPATRPRDVHHPGRQALVVEVSFDTDAVGHGGCLLAAGYGPSSTEAKARCRSAALQGGLGLASRGCAVHDEVMDGSWGCCGHLAWR